jgi:DNA mismatch repair protein MutS
MGITEDYLNYTIKWKKEYGEKTLVLMQVGSFFEVYALLDNNDDMVGSNIRDFSSINDMAISKKNSFVNKQQVVMAGFGVAQLEKYTKKLQDNGYTIVIYKQDRDISGEQARLALPAQTKNTTRSLSEIISPGTYFSHDATDELTNNTLCIWLHKSNKTKYATAEMTVGIAVIDIFTGKPALFQYVIEYSHTPTTYDELERYIAIYKPNECLIVSNLAEPMIQDVIGFIGLECRSIHIIPLATDPLATDPLATDRLASSTQQIKNAKSAEKQIYQQKIFKEYYPNLSSDTLLSHFPTHFIATQSFCLLLDFIHQHNPNLVYKLAPPLFENHTDKLILANHSLKQLNITDDSRHTGKLRSVSSFLNHCVTNMGKRRFIYNLHNPTTNSESLNQSYAITDHLLTDNNNNNKLWEYMRKQLGEIKDIEKLSRKIVLHKISPKELYLLVQNIKSIASLYELTTQDQQLTTYFLNNDIPETIYTNCLQIVTDLEDVFCLEKCKQVNEITADYLGSLSMDYLDFINKGVNPKIDEYMRDTFDEKAKLEAIRVYFSDILKKLEKSNNMFKNTDYIKIHETPKSSTVLLGTNKRVGSLKTQLLKTKPASDQLSYFSTYSQKNEEFTLHLNDLEYTTNGSNKKDMVVTNPQISKIVTKIQTSKDKLMNEIITWYNAYLDHLSKYETELTAIIQYTCLCDILQSKCYIAAKYNYCRPLIRPNEKDEKDEKDENKNGKAYLSFTGIRHPLIEHLQTNELYVTNDMTIGDNETNGILLYGTNAVGKTSFIKSIGIAVIMAQAGLFVPCETFVYFPYSSIFTRILGTDNIFKGLSTFAVEMTELRTILTLTDENSLVLGDELCSGTESDSALSIFTAGLEILHKNKCTFLFATHFHEIVNYAEIQKLSPCLKMMHMEVIYNIETGKLIYNRKLQKGSGDSMYGLEVCKSLNLPQSFLQRAHEIRRKYNPEQQNNLALSSSHFNAKKIVGNCEICNNVVKEEDIAKTVKTAKTAKTIKTAKTAKTTKATEVHHLQYQKNAKKENNYYIGSFHKNHPANLINVCESCHYQIHKTDSQKRVAKTIDGTYILVDIDS